MHLPKNLRSCFGGLKRNSTNGGEKPFNSRISPECCDLLVRAILGHYRKGSAYGKTLECRSHNLSLAWIDPVRCNKLSDFRTHPQLPLIQLPFLQPYMVPNKPTCLDGCSNYVSPGI
jgi:hypothetical protein